MPIQHIKNKDINRKKYHDCLRASYNANVFAYPWYLDLVCEHWDLLIEGDYETVCPLPLQKHFGITSVKQPALAPFLGVFSSKELPPEKVALFLKAIPFSNIQLTLNHFNRPGKTTKHKSRYLQVLDLISPYEIIQRTYSPATIELLNQPHNISILRTIRPDTYLAFKKKHHQLKYGSITDLSRIISYAIRYKSAGIYTVYSPFNELIGALFFIKTNHRVFLIDSVESAEGRENQAIVRAIDYVIKNNCGSDLTLEIPFAHERLTNAINFKTQRCLHYTKGFLNYLLHKL